jgi:hypothetical protein
LESFDFFIAYASPDRKQAEELSWLIEDESNAACKVFLDKQGIGPGDSWPTRLSDVLKASRATIVLISSHTDKAFYEHEEIARAIKLSRQEPDDHIVIPVLLEKFDGDMPYGTENLQAIDATRGGKLKRVARRLVELLDEWEEQDNKKLRSPTSNYPAFGAALRLDRYPQWGGVENACKDGGEHLLFLLHGPRSQNVGLFVERIQHFLSQETGKHHVVSRVPFKLGEVTPRCGADWVRHLRFALGGEGNAEQLLAQAVREQALFLALGLRPLDLSRLDDDQREGLREFIEESLPQLLQDARPRNEVRVLLAIDYANGLPQEPPVVAVAKNWARNAQKTGALRFIPLPPVKLPDWNEVELHLAGVKPPPSQEIIAELQAEYEQLTSGRELSYQELASMIDRYLQDA